MSAANINKFRWWIAKLWDRIFPLSCWAENATWAFGDIEGSELRFSGVAVLDVART